MESCARKIHFCYGHRLMGHEDKCVTLHGHNGVVWIHAVPIDGLDPLGRVLDFSLLKNKVGRWIDKHWDHTMIINEDDQEMITLLQTVSQYKPIFTIKGNPTAENMAKYILREVCPQVLKGCGIYVKKVVFYETENCFAEITLEETDKNIIDSYR